MGKGGSRQFRQKGEGKRCKIRGGWGGGKPTTQIQVLGTQREKGNLKHQKNAGRGRRKRPSSFEACKINNASQKDISNTTVASSWGYNGMNQRHAFCSHGLCQQNLFTELQSYQRSSGDIIVYIKATVLGS